MNRFFACLVPAMFLSAASLAQTQNAPALPYSPSLDVTSMDKSIDPCVDFYQYSCGGWQKRNPIPADQTSWSVYAKLYQDNLSFCAEFWKRPPQPKVKRNQVTQEIGDFYGSCMNEAVVNQRGVKAIQPQLDAIAALQSVRGHCAADGEGHVAVWQNTALRSGFHAGSRQFRAADCRSDAGRPWPSRSRLLHKRRRQIEGDPREVCCSMCRRSSSCWGTPRTRPKRMPRP